MDDRFGKFVREKREEKKINLRKLAEILEIAPAYMSDIEKSRRYPPDKEKIEKIAATLELTEEDLQQDEIQLSKYRALYLERMLEKIEVKSTKTHAFRQFVTDFEQIDEIEYELPQNLQATLRPYQ